MWVRGVWKDPKKYPKVANLQRQKSIAGKARIAKHGSPLPVGTGRIPGQAWKRTKKETLAMREQANKDADLIMAAMEDEGIIEPVTEETLSDDNKMAREALREVIVLLRMSGNAKDKLAAARTLLEYTRAKPASKQDLNVNAAEDFLAALLAKDKNG